MPNLPTYDSQRNITSQPAAPVRNEAKERAEVGVPLIEAAAEIQQKWQNAVDVVQETTARANYETELNEVINKANNDPEHNNSAAYKQEIEKIKERNLKGFQNKLVEQKVALDFDLGNRLANLKIDNIYNKKLIDVGRVSAFRLIDLEKSRYINAVDEQQKNSSAVAMKSIIDEQVKAGLFSAEEGYKLYEKSIKEAQEVIKDNEDLRKKQEKEILLAKEFAKNQREDELVKMRIDGALTPEIIRSDLNNELIDPKFAEAALNSLKSVKLEKPTSLDSIVKFNELVERNSVMAQKEASWFGMGKIPFEEITKFRADVINSNAQGYITDKQMNDLLSETSKTFYRDPVFQSALSQLSAQSKLYATSEAQARIKAEMYGNLIRKVIAGQNPRDAVTDVIKERISVELSEAVKEMPSEEDIAYTMKKRNLTREEVLKKIGFE